MSDHTGWITAQCSRSHLFFKMSCVVHFPQCNMYKPSSFGHKEQQRAGQSRVSRCASLPCFITAKRLHRVCGRAARRARDAIEWRRCACFLEEEAISTACRCWADTQQAWDAAGMGRQRMHTHAGSPGMLTASLAPQHAVGDVGAALHTCCARLVGPHAVHRLARRRPAGAWLTVTAGRITDAALAARAALWHSSSARGVFRAGIAHCAGAARSSSLAPVPHACSHSRPRTSPHRIECPETARPCHTRHTFCCPPDPL